MLKCKVYRFQEKIFVASNEHAAEVIGKHGLKIKRIAKDTQTFIKCPSPQNPPIFEIYAHKRFQIMRAKKQIQKFAEHFDKMKNKKRQIGLEADEKIETAWFLKIDVACIIGKQGRQIKKIMFYSQVKVISPDTNKPPIFILCGNDLNIKVCLFWMKLTAFTSSGNNNFTLQEISIISDYLQEKNGLNFYTQHIKEIVNVRILRERFNFVMMSNYAAVNEEEFSANSYHCWSCKGNSCKVAKSLCGHIIACDKCIAHLFVDIYLKCYYCHEKIETFLIKNY
jgi:hypothetical protein